jgi:hypothetical protein
VVCDDGRRWRLDMMVHDIRKNRTVNFTVLDNDRSWSLDSAIIWRFNVMVLVVRKNQTLDSGIGKS